MVNAHVIRSSDTSIEGYFDTTGRLWGGPDVVRIYFVAEFDAPFNSLDGWNDTETAHGIQEWQGPGIERCVARNSGMSYSDAPTAGVAANFGVKPGDRLCMKMAVSYVSIANARDNMAQECNHWNFDATRKASQA